MPLVDCGTCPHAHLVAFADVGVVAFVVKVDGENLNAVLNALGGVELHHVLVGQIVAARKDNSGRIDLDVALGAGGLSIDAGHSARVVGDQLDALGVEAHVGAGVDGHLKVVLHDGCQAGETDRGGIARQVFLGVVVGLRHGIHVGEHVVGLVLLGNLLVAAVLDHVEAGAARHEPVKCGTGFVVILRNDAVAGVVAALFHMHVHDGLLIHEAVAAAPLSLRLAAENGHVGCGAIQLGRRLQAHDLGARLRSGTSGRNAGAAQAHDYDVGINGLFDGGFVDGGRLAQPRHGAGAVVANRGAGSSGSGVSGVIGAARGRRRACAQAGHTSKRSAGNGSARQEIAASETLGFFGHD